MVDYFRYMVNKINNYKTINESLDFNLNVDEDYFKITIGFEGEVYGTLIMVKTFEPITYELSDIPEDIYNKTFTEDILIKIEHIEVIEGFKNEGIGTKLMEYGLNMMINKGFSEFFLNASPMGFSGLNLTDLVKFYNKFGFKELLNQGNNVIMYKN